MRLVHAHGLRRFLAEWAFFTCAIVPGGAMLVWTVSSYGWRPFLASFATALLFVGGTFGGLALSSLIGRPLMSDEERKATP